MKSAGVHPRRGAAAIVLATVMGLMVPAFASSSGTFVDDDASVHEPAIEALAALDIVRGCNPPANDRYCPRDPLTRGQMAAILRRALQLPVPGVDYFADDSDSVFERDINAVAAAGITRGCNPPANDAFCPAEEITREQMAAFLVRAYNLPAAGAGDPFVDDDNSTFEADIESLAAANITHGCNPPANTRFCPRDPLTRAAMASLLWRTLVTLGYQAPVPPASATAVTIRSGGFHVNGLPTNPGSAAEGLLVNLRTVQGIFDDENPATRDRWAYPSGQGSGTWTSASVERNVTEFVAAMGDWARAGLDAFTLSLQGGNPNADDNAGGGPTSADRSEVVSAFRADGSLKAAWKDRLTIVLDEADRLGMVVILNLFYKHQSDELADQSAVLAATDTVIDFLWKENDYYNVIFDVANEVSPRASGPPSGYAHDILTIARVHEVMRHMHAYAAANYPGHVLAVSASMSAATDPTTVPDAYFEQADFVLWHGNGIDMSTQASYIQAIRRRTAKPIVWNEDNHTETGTCPQRTIAAVAAKGDPTIALGVGWGLHWKGCNDYRRGYQAMPVNWDNTAGDPFKAGFLSWVTAITGS